jgi:DeoR/GlpR family transcriptional regulator of sugar metabolism
VTSDSGSASVFAEERQDFIARIVEEHGRAHVADLAARFAVSRVTIRKDLAALEAQRRLVRTHGGAVAVGRGAERAFDVRERIQRAEKDAIGREAAAMVVDGESIALDASTTALALARHLKARGGWLHLTVITNGLRIASELAGHPGITVAMPAGFVRWEALSLVGPLGAGLFEKVNVQKAFMGAAGFAIDAGLSDATEEEAQIKRLMVDGASQVIGLVDHTKWGRTAFATFCRTAALTAVVADDLAPDALVEAVRTAGIDLHLATVGDADEGAAPTRARASAREPW